jgi:hypothetical protein
MDKVNILTSINDIYATQFSKIKYIDISSNLLSILYNIASDTGYRDHLMLMDITLEIISKLSLYKS